MWWWWGLRCLFSFIIGSYSNLPSLTIRSISVSVVILSLLLLFFILKMFPSSSLPKILSLSDSMAEVWTSFKLSHESKNKLSMSLLASPLNSLLEIACLTSSSKLSIALIYFWLCSIIFGSVHLAIESLRNLTKVLKCLSTWVKNLKKDSMSFCS